jgi:hypothetical protein
MKQHKLSYNIINSLSFIILSCKSKNNIELQRYLRLVRRQKSISVMQKQVQVSVNSTRVLFTYLKAQDIAYEKLQSCPLHLLLAYRKIYEDWIAFSPLSWFIFPWLSRSSFVHSFGAATTLVTIISSSYMCNTQICKSLRNEIIFSICVALTHWYMWITAFKSK